MLFAPWSTKCGCISLNWKGSPSAGQRCRLFGARAGDVSGQRCLSGVELLTSAIASTAHRTGSQARESSICRVVVVVCGDIIQATHIRATLVCRLAT